MYVLRGNCGRLPIFIECRRLERLYLQIGRDFRSPFYLADKRRKGVALWRICSHVGLAVPNRRPHLPGLSTSRDNLSHIRTWKSVVVDAVANHGETAGLAKQTFFVKHHTARYHHVDIRRALQCLFYYTLRVVETNLECDLDVVARKYAAAMIVEPFPLEFLNGILIRAVWT